MPARAWGAQPCSSAHAASKRCLDFEGQVSVQDKGAQTAAPYSVCSPECAYWTCAAPGGKATHMLELADCDLSRSTFPEQAGRIGNFIRRSQGNCMRS